MYKTGCECDNTMYQYTVFYYVMNTTNHKAVKYCMWCVFHLIPGRGGGAVG